MIILSSTTQSIEMTMTATVTNPVDYVTCWVDVTSTTFTPAGVAGFGSFGTFTYLSGPAASTQRQIKYISAYNADTVANTQHWKINTSGTVRTLFRVTLQPGETVIYMNDCGWTVYNASGYPRNTLGDVVGPGSSTDNAAVRFDGTTGKLVQSSNVTIDDTGNISLPALATVDGVDISVLNDFRPISVVKSADQTVASTTPANCTGLSFAGLVAGTYCYRFVVFWDAAATTTGLELGVDYTGTVTNTRYGATIPQSASSASWLTAAADAASLTAANSLLTTLIATLEGALTVSTSGTLNLQISGDAAANLTVRQNSFGTLQRVV